MAPILVVSLQVMPYSTGCTTTLSNFEAGQNYKDVDDPAVTVSLSIAIIRRGLQHGADLKTDSQTAPLLIVRARTI